MKPIVAIVGRPNVGKSTLFNKLIGRRSAIVVNEPGVTRDLNYADTEEVGRSFTLIDTGGFEPGAEDIIFSQVKEQAVLAIEDADVIIFVMDGRAGVNPQDATLVDMLRKAGKPVVYAVNKLDSPAGEAALADFYSLGVEPLVAISAEHGRNLNGLMDAVIEKLPEVGEEPEEPGERVRVAIVGRPNAGKSSILNRLIGRRRAIVSEVAGTTRDPVNTPYDLDGKKYLFIDTAGIRKKKKVSLTVETYCVMEAIRSIDECDVAVLVIDGSDGLQGQDEKIAGLIEDRKKCCIIVVNKWDLVEKDSNTTALLTDIIRSRMPFIAYAPVVFTSALSGQRVSTLFPAIDKVVEESRRRVQTSVLNNIIEGVTVRHRPPSYRGRNVKFYYATQSGVGPPTFVIFTNHPEGVSEQYKRYVTNSLREALGLDNVPLKVFFRKRH